MDGKVALVTGAGKRLGRAIAQALAADGWSLVVHYNASRAEAEALAAEIGGRAARFDLEDTDAVQDFLRAQGRVDALINSASIFEPDRPEDVTPDLFIRQLRVNLMAPVLLASAMAEAHTARNSGCVVNLLDQKLFNLNPDFFSYTLSKYALLGATQTMAMALAPRVRVNAVAPGVTLPVKGQTAQEFERAHRLNPMQGGATPDDVVRAVRFILATPSITGETIIVDGGQHLDARRNDVLYSSGKNEVLT
jgi:NAD(P)-dependent dehydrogenase (short-subunit alcohol dehydrogenase family)